MNSLVLIPGRSGVRCSRVRLREASHDVVGSAAEPTAGNLVLSMERVGSALVTEAADAPVDLVAIRSVYGGAGFRQPIIVEGEHRNQFLALRSQAPLSVASTTSLIESVREAFPKMPIAVAFETSFFVDLPARETTYALPSDVGQAVRRWGYHGLFHEAATAEMAHALGQRRHPARMLSICLDSRPEMAAVLGRHPRMVTSGSTPVEGLPGEHNCGEIDPAIALALAADPDIGPERANLVLTRESGFAGMLGWPVTLGDVLTDQRARVAGVRQHLLYHMALAAGSALAALEGLDGVVFSGRYAKHAEKVAEYLMPQIERTLGEKAGTLPWHVCWTPIDRLVAEAGMTAWLAWQKGAENQRT